MALRATATGIIAEPVLRWTPQQKAVLDLRLNATASARDKGTGEWSDVGAPLWLGATFWDEEAKHLSEVLGKGDRITVEGTLVIETFKRRDGTEAQKYVLRYPKFLGVVPGRRSTAEDPGAYGGTHSWSNIPAEGAPFSGPIPRVDRAQPAEEAPF